MKRLNNARQGFVKAKMLRQPAPLTFHQVAQSRNATGLMAHVVSEVYTWPVDAIFMPPQGCLHMSIQNEQQSLWYFRCTSGVSCHILYYVFWSFEFFTRSCVAQNGRSDLSTWRILQMAMDSCHYWNVITVSLFPVLPLLYPMHVIRVLMSSTRIEHCVLL